MKSSPIALAAVLFLSAALVATAPCFAADEDTQKVVVQNFPKTQTVDGQVEVQGPIAHGSVDTGDQVVVSPVRLEETARLVPGGVIDTAGYTHVVLGLIGESNGTVTQPGRVGAFLLPVDPDVRSLFSKKGLRPFALAVQIPEVSAATPEFWSEPVRHLVGFGQYQVYFFNETDKSVSLRLHAYLTN